jgi:hypothetical protein
MTSMIDTFLDHDNFQKVSSVVSSFLDECSKLPKDKRVKCIKQTLNFQKVFDTDSVQGIAGVANIETDIPITVTQPDQTDHVENLCQQIVFKLSVEVNRTIEHEFFILKKLNQLRKFCPNFVGTFGLLSAYVNKSFFDDPNPKTLKNPFDIKNNVVPSNYLLLEYVGDVTFRHVYNYADKQTVTGVLLSVLCALQVAQTKLKFTHYDLHSDNILMRKVEDTAYFAYIIDGKCMVYPTHGWYPVIIDMGSSYIDGINERPTRTSIKHYQDGLQSTNYDPLSDLHHFVLSAVSRLEKTEKQSDDFCRHFRLIAGRMMHIFRHSNIWRHKGWKHLPCNLYYLFNEAVNRANPKLCEFYAYLRSEIVETLSLGVKLPWKELSEEDLQQLILYYYPTVSKEEQEQFNDPIEFLLKMSMEDINHFLLCLDEDPLTKSDISIIYALRALVEHASLINRSTTFEVSREIVNNYKAITHSLYPNYSAKLDLIRSFRGASCVCTIMRHMLLKFNEPNITLIQEWNQLTDIKSAWDIASFIKQNTAIRYTFNSQDPLYIWDCDKENHVKTTFGAINAKSEDKNLDKLILHFVAEHKQ